MHVSELKAFVKAGAFAEAAEWLVEGGIYLRDSSTALTAAKQIRLIPPSALIQRGYLHKKIAVLGGYTTQLIVAALQIELLIRGVVAEFFESEYGTFEQDIIGRNLELERFRPDLIYLCVGSDHLQGSEALQEAERWLSIFKRAEFTFGCIIVMNSFEEPLHRAWGNLEFRNAESRSNFVGAVNQGLKRNAPSFVHFVDINYLAGRYGRNSWRDEKFYDIAKVPVSAQHLFDYAESVAGVMAGIFGRSRKCLVLDLDNTIWGGVVGDDGVANLQIGEGSGTSEAFRRFQTFIGDLKKRGVILAVCSKNEESNAKEPFTQRRSDMVLRLEDISCFVANWEPKDRNLALIAQTLNIGLDSLVFVDDNPAERALVRQSLPQVEVVELPDDPAFYTATLSRLCLFDVPVVTHDDLQRSAQYQANSERQNAMDVFTDYGDYLKSLKMQATLSPFDEMSLPRIGQLINKTNQFNLTTKRYSDVEVSQIARCSTYLSRYVKVKDRFGDNGLISVFIAKTLSIEVLEIDTWLMSCRVLKRGVESLLFAHVVRDACALGFKSLVGNYIPTKKNHLVANLFRDFEFEIVERQDGGIEKWAFDLANETKVKTILSLPIFIEVVSDASFGG